MNEETQGTKEGGDATDRELAELQAELDQLDRQEEEREARRRRERLVAERRREVEERRAVVEAEEKHGPGNFAVVDTDAAVVLVKRPSPMRYRKFAAIEKLKPEHAHRLAVACVIYPDREAFNELAEEYPGIPMLAASAALDLAVGRQGDRAGK